MMWKIMSTVKENIFKVLRRHQRNKTSLLVQLLTNILKFIISCYENRLAKPTSKLDMLKSLECIVNFLKCECASETAKSKYLTYV